MSFGNRKPPSRRNDRLDELLPIYNFADNDQKTVAMRPIGNIISYEFIWFHIITPSGIKKIPKLNTDLDPITDEYVANDSPFRKDGRGEISRIYLINAINRKLQDAMPAKLPKLRASEKKLIKTTSFNDKMNYKEHLSDSWTPVVPLRFYPPAVTNIASLEAENIVDGKSYGAADLDYGFDLKIKYNSKGSGSGKMIITEGEPSAITDEEMEYLVYDLDVLKYPTLAEEMADWKTFKEKITDAPEDKKGTKGGAKAASRLEEDEEEDDIRSSRKSSKSNSSKLSRGRSRDDEDDDVPY